MKKIFLAISIIILMLSCEDEITINTSGGENQMVIEGYITTKADTQYIRISKSVSYYENKYNSVQNAIVTVTDFGAQKDSVKHNFTHLKDGYYMSVFKGVIGRIYNLEVVDNTNVYTAIDSIRRNPKIDSIRVFKDPMNDKEKVVYVYTQDFEGKGDCVKWNTFLNGFQMRRLVFVDDEFVDGNYVDNMEIYDDQAENKYTSESEKIKDGTEIVVEQCVMTKPVYDFYIDLQAQVLTNPLFSTPAANIKGNIWTTNDKGQKIRVNGVFSTQSVQSDTIIFKMSDLRITKSDIK